MPKQPTRLAIRGLLLDPARLTERHDFYVKLLPRLAAWGYNTIWWHFCDDEGCSIRLTSHPELAAPYAFTCTEIRRFCAAAREVDIDVVPEVETLGHSRWITEHPRYAHLRNGDPYGHNAVCPSHPDTVPLMSEIVEEVAGLFDAPYLHAGLDEAVFHACPRCRRSSRGKPQWWLLARHARRIHRIVTGCGKRMIMWADPVEKNPALLNELPPDVVLAHWHYGDVPAERIQPSTDAGFQIVCVSAMSGEMPQPDTRNLVNVDDNIRLAARLGSAGCLGSVVCWWEPFRILRDTFAFPVAYAGRAMQRGRPLEHKAFLRRFLAKEYGLDNAAATRAFRAGCALAPGMKIMRVLLPASPADLVAAIEQGHREETAQWAAEADNAAGILDELLPRVARRREEFAAAVLALQIVAQAYRNGIRVTALYERYRQAADADEMKVPRERVLKLLQEVAEGLEQMHRETDALARAAAQEWNRTRHPRDTKKDNSSSALRQRGSRALLARLLRSATYLRQLCVLLRSGAAAYRGGGPFPGGVRERMTQARIAARDADAPAGPDCTLYGPDQIPVAPFRSDAWPRSTESPQCTGTS